MATVSLNKNNLEKLITESNILMIDFWAEWCAPCKMFSPVFEKASEKHKDIVFAECNTEEEQEVAAAFGIMSIPTLAIFKEGILIYKEAGALPESALENIISQVRNLNMDEVRRKIKEQQSGKQEQ